MLFIVGTPIGNLEDFSPRAVKTLASCDLILAEDTRHSMHLLKHFLISTPLKSYHMHNEQQRGEQVLELLKSNKNIGLISDAGMPMVSDPGYVLVKKIHEHNLFLEANASNKIDITVIPGPTALTSAISLSGIDCRNFCFAGFLDTRQVSRQKQLDSLYKNNSRQAIVLYEAPHRLLNTLNDIQIIMGQATSVSVIKEITKQYETVYYGSVTDVLKQFEDINTNGKIRGEYVIVIDNNGLEQSEQMSDQELEIN